MQSTVINIPSFQGQYKTGLVFSLIEGLKPGQSLRLVCDENPSELEALLQNAAMKEVRWSTSRDPARARWEVFVQKSDPFEEGVGCCGMCGSKKTQGA